MNHQATPRFWAEYHRLPLEVQQLADRCYAQLRQDPRHPSLHFKRIGELWSVRVGLHFRALGIEEGQTVVWVWIGSHAEYDRLVEQGPS